MNAEQDAAVKALRFLNEVISSPDLMLADDSFATSPSMASLFSPASALSDNTSPLFFPGSITPSDLDTPLFDTPSIGPSPADLLTSPLFDLNNEFEFDDMPLFPADDPGLAANVHVANPQIDASPAGGSNTLSLVGLGTSLPTMSPQLISHSPTSSTSDVPPSRRLTKNKPRPAPYAVPSNAGWTGAAQPTGHRRNITSSALIPVDAPTQQRQYYSPSTTSRKDIPAAFAHRALNLAQKRTVTSAGFDDMGEDEEYGLMSAIEAKRRQNTLAARRSRQRKLDHVRNLEELLARMTADRDQWKERALQAESKIQNGM